ncbi:YggT family protein [Bacillus chungangensis]|uniref:YggT family protein n=1 Tax=Bacillus chungangensis TaxID=587633 RepID=A0ABT9WXP5_9BACI|nr:YggT family protein [Bacillus chungangensis]MDQ0177647.1 YggT family protein [Bacillus chungangensis]
MRIVFDLLGQIIVLYSWVLIVYILMSWFPNSRETSFGQVMANLCEPYLEPFRKIIPPLGMIDISPIVAILVLRFASYGVIYLKYMF